MLRALIYFGPSTGATADCLLPSKGGVGMLGVYCSCKSGVCVKAACKLYMVSVIAEGPRVVCTGQGRARPFGRLFVSAMFGSSESVL